MRDQRGTARSIVLWGGAFGVVLLIVAAAASFFLVPQKTNISDQSPTGSSSSVTGSTPSQSGTGGDAPGSATR